MTRMNIALIILMLLLIGCTHMNSTVQANKIVPDNGQWNELVSLVKQIVSSPPRICSNLGLDASGDVACEISAVLVDRIEIEPTVGSARLDVVVAIKPMYCVSPADLVGAFPKEWGFEFIRNGDGPADSSEIVLTETYESSIMKERIILGIEPGGRALCLNSLRVIHWE